jgi:hypothetical protein
MEVRKPEEYPILYQIYGGKWAASGDGWAVHGNTQEEAIENYRKAEQRHQEILAMPPWHTLTPEQKVEANLKDSLCQECGKPATHWIPNLGPYCQDHPSLAEPIKGEKNMEKRQLADGDITVWEQDGGMIIHHTNGLTIALMKEEAEALFDWMNEGVEETTARMTAWMDAH